MSEAINGASIDLASFHNFQGTAAESSMILTKALLGEAESLKTNFGITIQQNGAFQKSVKARMALTGSTQSAAKAEMIFASIMSQLVKQKALDNFNKTLGSYANQQRVAAEGAKQLKESFGALLLPAVIKITKKLIVLVDKVNSISEGNKKLILIAVGVVAALGPLALIIGAVAFAIAGLTAGLALLSLPVLAVIAGAVLLGNALYGLYSNFDTIVTSISNLFTMLADVAIKTLKSISNGIVDFLLAPIKLAAEGMAALGFDGMKNKIMEFQRKITFETGDKKLGIDANSTAKSQADVNINVNAPKGVVSSTTTKRRGDPMNLGMSMRTQP